MRSKGPIFGCLPAVLCLFSVPSSSFHFGGFPNGPSKSTLVLTTSYKTGITAYLASPSALEESPTSNLQWLQERFNLTDKWSKRPNSRRLETLDRKVLEERLDWLQKSRLNFTEEDLAYTVSRSPEILAMNSDTNLKPTLDFLAEQLSRNETSLYRVVRKYPNLLGSGIGEHHQLQQNINWIKGRLSLSDAEVEKIFLRAPHVMVMDLDPKFDWFQYRLGLDLNQTVKIFKIQPAMFGNSLENCLEPRLVWLQHRLGMDLETARKMICRQPTILFLSIDDKMELALGWLEATFSVRDLELSKMVASLPNLLTYSIPENLEPTLQFYIEACVENEEIVIEWVKRYSRVLTYSLEKRLKPRLKQAEELGFEINTTVLRKMAMYTEKQWEDVILKASM